MKRNLSYCGSALVMRRSGARKAPRRRARVLARGSNPTPHPSTRSQPPASPRLPAPKLLFSRHGDDVERPADRRLNRHDTQLLVLDLPRVRARVRFADTGTMSALFQQLAMLPQPGCPAACRGHSTAAIPPPEPPPAPPRHRWPPANWPTLSARRRPRIEGPEHWVLAPTRRQGYIDSFGLRMAGCQSRARYDC